MTVSPELLDTDTDTTSHEPLAARTSERCPSCSAPIVGTNPSFFPALRSAREACRISSMVLWIFNRMWEQPFAAVQSSEARQLSPSA